MCQAPGHLQHVQPSSLDCNLILSGPAGQTLLFISREGRWKSNLYVAGRWSFPALLPVVQRVLVKIQRFVIPSCFFRYVYFAV